MRSDPDGAGHDNHAESLPTYATRRALAQAITAQFFPVRPSTVARWALPWVRVGRVAVAPSALALAEAERRLRTAPRCGIGSRSNPRREESSNV